MQLREPTEVEKWRPPFSLVRQLSSGDTEEQTHNVVRGHLLHLVPTDNHLSLRSVNQYLAYSRFLLYLVRIFLLWSRPVERKSDLETMRMGFCRREKQN